MHIVLCNLSFLKSSMRIRNQRMTEELSVINGGVQVYYDKSASQGLMISDSDEELEVPENAKHEFSQGDDQVLW